MFPVADDEEVVGGDDDVDDNLSHLVKTDQIPSSLLKDILEEAGLYNNLSNFLSR